MPSNFWCFLKGLACSRAVPRNSWQQTVSTDGSTLAGWATYKRHTMLTPPTRYDETRLCINETPIRHLLYNKSSLICFILPPCIVEHRNRRDRQNTSSVDELFPKYNASIATTDQSDRRDLVL